MVVVNASKLTPKTTYRVGMLDGLDRFIPGYTDTVTANSSGQIYAKITVRCDYHRHSEGARSREHLLRRQNQLWPDQSHPADPNPAHQTGVQQGGFRHLFPGLSGLKPSPRASWAVPITMKAAGSFSCTRVRSWLTSERVTTQ